jgi:hypothetical protein
MRKNKTSTIYWMIGIGIPGFYFLLKVIELLARVPDETSIVF